MTPVTVEHLFGPQPEVVVLTNKNKVLHVTHHIFIINVSQVIRIITNEYV